VAKRKVSFAAGCFRGVEARFREFPGLLARREHHQRYVEEQRILSLSALARDVGRERLITPLGR
jgi:hypothetical protein